MIAIRPIEVLSMRRVLFFLTALSLLVLPLVGSSGLGAQQLQQLEIATKNGVHIFGVELAVTPEEQARGLMFRRELPERQGMLFDFKREQPTSFWMKNTYISLDMIFIRADGRILSIAENTVPLSEELVSSGGPVRAVLEVIAGTSKKLGIAPGDRVTHPIFSGR
jgi:uncharacterized protein